MSSEKPECGNWSSYKGTLAENQRLRDENAKLVTEIENLKEQNRSLVDKNEKLTTKLEIVNGVVKENDIKFESLEEKVASLQKEVNVQKDTILESKNLEGELRKEVGSLRKEVSVQNGTIVKFENLEAELRREKEKVNLLQKEVQDQKETILKLEDDLKSERHQVTNLQKKVKDQKEKIKSQEQDLNVMEGSLKKLYLAAGVAIGALGGQANVPMVHFGKNGNNGALLVDKVCEGLQVKVKEWQRSQHEMHNELVQATENNKVIIESFEVQEKGLQKKFKELQTSHQGDYNGLVEIIKNAELLIERLEGKLEESDRELENAQTKLEEEKRNSLEQQQQVFSEIKGYILNLYGIVLEGLGEDVPPSEEKSQESLEECCRLLEGTFLAWKENHQTVENRMEETLKVMEALVEQTSYKASKDNDQSSTVSNDEEFESVSDVGAQENVSSPAASLPEIQLPGYSDCDDDCAAEAEHIIMQKELYRKRRLVMDWRNQNVDWLQLPIYGCRRCEDNFCRLTQVSSNLSTITQAQDEVKVEVPHGLDVIKDETLETESKLEDEIGPKKTKKRKI